MWGRNPDCLEENLLSHSKDVCAEWCKAQSVAHVCPLHQGICTTCIPHFIKKYERREFCCKQLFLPFTFILYLCHNPYFIHLLSVTLGEICKVFKLCRPQRLVKAGSPFRRIKVTLQGKPSQPTYFIAIITCRKGDGQMNSSPSLISETNSVSTCGRMGSTGRHKCDLFSGNMSTNLRSSSFEV